MKGGGRASHCGMNKSWIHEMICEWSNERSEAGGSNQQQSSISFQQINQQIKLFWFDGLIVDEMKSCWFAPPHSPIKLTFLFL